MKIIYKCTLASQTGTACVHYRETTLKDVWVLIVRIMQHRLTCQTIQFLSVSVLYVITTGL